MDRRDFFEKSCAGAFGLALAHFGLKVPLGAKERKMTREEMIRKLLMEKMGKTEEEAAEIIGDFKEKLPMVEEMCVCKKCPSYVRDETLLGFCHPLVGKSKVITGEQGCICGSCPVYKKMKMKYGYYCTRGAEIELKVKNKD